MADAYEAKRLGGRWRVVNAGTNDIALGDEGRPLDGGGHDNDSDARRQAAAYAGRDYQKARKVGGKDSGSSPAARGGPFDKINKALKGARK